MRVFSSFGMVGAAIIGIALLAFTGGAYAHCGMEGNETEGYSHDDISCSMMDSSSHMDGMDDVNMAAHMREHMGYQGMQSTGLLGLGFGGLGWAGINIVIALQIALLVLVVVLIFIVLGSRRGRK